MMKNITCCAIILILFSSCTMVRSVSQTSIPKNRDRVVEAQVTNNIFLLLNFSTNYTHNLTEQLSRQCPTGKVQGILTTDTITTYFPLLFYREEIRARGYCND